MAMLIVLESLSPAERSAFLLHDVFGYSFAGGRGRRRPDAAGDPPAGDPARHAVEARRPRYPAALDQQREVISAFHAAAEEGDLASLLELLDPAVTFRSDGGGVVSAARKVITGAERVARVISRMAGHFGDAFRLTAVTVNGAPGLILDTGGSPSVIAFTIDQGRITEIDAVRNPEKLRTLSRTRVRSRIARAHGEALSGPAGGRIARAQRVRAGGSDGEVQQMSRIRERSARPRPRRGLAPRRRAPRQRSPVEPISGAAAGCLPRRVRPCTCQSRHARRRTLVAPPVTHASVPGRAVHGTIREHGRQLVRALARCSATPAYCVFALNYGQEAGRVVGLPGALAAPWDGAHRRFAPASWRRSSIACSRRPMLRSVDIVGYSQVGMMPSVLRDAFSGAHPRSARGSSDLPPSNHGTDRRRSRWP